MTLMEKDNKEIESADFNLLGAIFGCLYPLFKGNFKGAGIVILAKVCTLIISVLFLLLFSIFKDMDYASFDCAYLFLAFIVDGFITAMIDRSKLEKDGWKEKK